MWLLHNHKRQKPTLNCVATAPAAANSDGRLLSLVAVMDGWPLSWLWHSWLWRIGAAKSGVHGAGVFCPRKVLRAMVSGEWRVASTPIILDTHHTSSRPSSKMAGSRLTIVPNLSATDSRGKKRYRNFTQVVFVYSQLPTHLFQKYSGKAASIQCTQQFNNKRMKK